MRKKLVIAGAAVPVLIAAAAAWAAWTASGSGTGSASATSAVALTLTATGLDDLYPGGSADLDVTVTNPNPYPVHIHQIAGNGAIGASGGCNATSVVLNGPFDTSGDPATIAAGGSRTYTLAGAVSMDNTATDACQGASFTLPLLATGESAAAPH